MTEPRWEHFHHQADVGVRGIGATPARAFEQAAVALTATMTDPALVAPLTAVPVACEAPDLRFLLADWLNDLVYEMSVRKMIFGRFEVEIDGGRLRATAWGEAVDVGRHEPAVEVKGATLTELAVTEVEPGLWVAECVVDV